MSIVPQGGIGNRLRVISGALSFFSHTDEILKIYWYRNKALNCHFKHLLQPINGVQIIEATILHKIYIRLLPHFNKNIRVLNSKDIQQLKHTPVIPALRKKTTHNNGAYTNNLETVMFSALNQNRHLLLKTYIPPSDRMLYRLFNPIAALSRRIADETQSFDSHTIGIHIRQTDNTIAIANSPLHLFEACIEKEIDDNSNANFYLATDTWEIRQYLTIKYSGHILPTSTEKLNRNTKSGVRKAIVEMYALSKTNKIYASCYSSFSDLPTQLGNAKRIRVKI